MYSAVICCLVMNSSDLRSVCLTGSSKNQPTATSGKRSSSRKRGISATLVDATNILDMHPSKRAAKENAVSAITFSSACSTMLSPRGEPQKGGILAGQTHKLGSKGAAANNATCTYTDSLCQIVRHNQTLYRKGKECIDEYITKNTPTDLNKAFTIKIMTTAMDTWGCNITEAAKMAADVSGCSAETVRQWASSFFIAIGGSPENIDADFVYEELSSHRGHGSGNQSYIIHDEDFRLRAREFVRSHASIKGEPNLTVHQFRDWIEATFGVCVCDSTARVWLHHLGFSQKNHQKGVFFDGHDREDVVKDRVDFLNTLAELDKKTITPDAQHPDLQEGEKPYLRVVHDESTFYANAYQSQFWSDGQVEALRQKSLGQSIMVSDFLVEGDGYLRDGQQEARLFLETQRDGYFNSSKFLEQVDAAVDIFERKYPNRIGVFLFDNAPCHKKMADDALNVEHMNVNPGGKQSKLRDTQWNGQAQRMVNPNGEPKGLRQVLEERGVDTSGMIAQKLRETLGKFSDFASQKTILQEKIEGRGHVCLYFPKYHCEINPIERNWCHAKKHSRAYCNGSITRLRRIVPEALETVTLDMMNKFFVTCRDYERAYREGHTGKGAIDAIKVYKSHRRVFNVSQ